MGRILYFCDKKTVFWQRCYVTHLNPRPPRGKGSYFGIPSMITDSNQVRLANMTGRRVQEVLNEIVPHQFFEKSQCQDLTTPPTSMQ